MDTLLEKFVVSVRRHIGWWMFGWFVVMMALDTILISHNPNETIQTSTLLAICFWIWVTLLFAFLAVLWMVDNLYPEGWSRSAES